MNELNDKLDQLSKDIFEQFKQLPEENRAALLQWMEKTKDKSVEEAPNFRHVHPDSCANCYFMMENGIYRCMSYTMVQYSTAYHASQCVCDDWMKK